MPQRRPSPAAADDPPRSDPQIFTEQTVESLEGLITTRNMNEALALFRRHAPVIWQMPANNCDAVILGDCCARLLDRDRGHLNSVETFLARFTPEIRSDFSILLCARLDLANAVVHFHRDRIDAALALLTEVKELSERNGLDSMVPIAEYYMARSHARLGNAELAIKLVRAAKAKSKHPRMIAQIEMTEAWNLFTMGRVREAHEVLNSAQSGFGEDLRQQDYVEYCNVLSFHARIKRQRGDLEGALQLFEDAAKELAAHGDEGITHPVYGRLLIQKAATQSLLARALGDVKRVSQREREKAGAEINTLRKDALANLAAAEVVYKTSRRGSGNVHSHRAWAYLDKGEYFRARSEASRASEMFDNQDPVAKAHCLIIQCHIELQDGENGDILKARAYAQEAVDRTAEMQRRRVRARALIALASTLVRPPWDSVADAKKCLEKAKALIDVEEDRDYLMREFQECEGEFANATTQKRRILEVTLSDVLVKGLDETLLEVEKKIVETVYRDAEHTSISGTAHVLKTTRNRVKRILR